MEGVFALALGSWTWARGTQENLREGQGISNGGAVICRGEHEFSEALPETGGEQVVDDGVDRGAEIEEDA